MEPPRERRTSRSPGSSHDAPRLAVLAIAGADASTSSARASSTRRSVRAERRSPAGPRARPARGREADARARPSPYATYLSHHGFATIAASVLAAISIIFAVARARLRRRGDPFPAPGRPDDRALVSLVVGGVGFAAAQRRPRGHRRDRDAQPRPRARLQQRRRREGAQHERRDHVRPVRRHPDRDRVRRRGRRDRLHALSASGCSRRSSATSASSSPCCSSSRCPRCRSLTALWLAARRLPAASGRWPSGDPPAWASGEARPWPSAAEQRMQREGGDARPRRAGPAASRGDAGAAAEPSSRSSPRRRRRPPWTGRPSRRLRSTRARTSASGAAAPLALAGRLRVAEPPAQLGELAPGHGTSLPSANTIEAVPSSSGRTSTARLRLAM